MKRLILILLVITVALGVWMLWPEVQPVQQVPIYMYWNAEGIEDGWITNNEAIILDFFIPGNAYDFIEERYGGKAWYDHCANTTNGLTWLKMY